MTTEEFQKLVAQCQPHKVFSNDWETFYSIDFANTLLPDVKGYIGKAMRMYDGADLFKNIEKTDSKVLKITNDKDLIYLVSYTYPKGVEAERKKECKLATMKFAHLLKFRRTTRLSCLSKLAVNSRTFLRDITKAISYQTIQTVLQVRPMPQTFLISKSISIETSFITT
ncbi:MAG: hypothetical protein K9G46_15540 [Flavobacteriales bacterium]|nr:hypothetical protein [Flavobacteriales bacterium]